MWGVGDDEEVPFKTRYGNHLTTVRYEKYRKNTELSKHLWALQDQGEEYDIRGTPDSSVSQLSLLDGELYVCSHRPGAITDSRCYLVFTRCLSRCKLSVSVSLYPW